MGIISDKLQQKINDTNIIKYGDTIAEIIEYNNINNTASIQFINPNGGNLLTADNVSIRMSGGGFSQSSPVIGQTCWVTFLSNNLLTPVITSFADDMYYNNIYSQKTNKDQGAYIVDSYIRNIDTSIETTPMVDDYFNESESSQYKLISKDYTNVNALVEINKMLAEIDKYSSSEDGITNLSTKSTAKFKSNGDVDIFVDNNTGVRISPKTKTISLFGKSLNTMMTENWVIDIPNIIINGNVQINGTIKTEDNK